MGESIGMLDRPLGSNPEDAIQLLPNCYLLVILLLSEDSKRSGT